MKNKERLICAALALLCCATVLANTVLADGYYSSNENGDNEPGEAIDQISISTEYVPNPEISGGGETNITWDINAEEIDGILSGFISLMGTAPLTPNGNMNLVDDILQDESYYTVQDQKILKDKQFITVQTKNGNYFYIIIDRSGETENVYFLNLVDESDLFALLEDGKNGTAQTCTCKTKCEAGDVDTDCPVCRYSMKDCKGTQKKTVEKTPETTENTQNQQTAAEQTDNKKSSIGIYVVIGAVLIAGGVAVYWFKFRKKKPDVKGDTDLDDYDYGENEEPEKDDEEGED